jgi:hypothetical protein
MSRVNFSSESGYILSRTWTKRDYEQLQTSKRENGTMQYTLHRNSGGIVFSSVLLHIMPNLAHQELKLPCSLPPGGKAASSISCIILHTYDSTKARHAAARTSNEGTFALAHHNTATRSSLRGFPQWDGWWTGDKQISRGEGPTLIICSYHVHQACREK